MATQKASSTVLSLYRQLLRHGNKFPSIKRKDILADIRLGKESTECARIDQCVENSKRSPAEFREHMNEPNEQKIAKYIETARRGLETMQKYTTLPKTAPSWTVKLEEDPLGQRESEQRRAEAYHKQQLEKAKLK